MALDKKIALKTIYLKVFFTTFFVFFINFAYGVEQRINFQASVLPKETGIHLQVSLENNGVNSISLYKADLPWSSRHSLILVAVTDDKSLIRLNENLFIDDPIPGQITIKPTQKITGTIDLTQRFPQLRETLKNQSIILFIQYQLKSPNGGLTQRFNDGIFLKKIE